MSWIKLHRKILDHWLYEPKRPKSKFEAWIHILLTVNYKPSKAYIRGVVYECDRGQSLLSLESWAKEFNWSVQSVRTFFKQLEIDQNITTEGLQYTTRLTVCNYDTYQDILTDEQQTNQQAANRPLTTIKERKKERSKEYIQERAKIFYSQVAEYINTYSPAMLRSFYDYWTEPNKSNTKMKFELQQTWDLSRRLNNWHNRENKSKVNIMSNPELKF